nr:ABC transporter permease [uncultured Janthinobacterium sp.]
MTSTVSPYALLWKWSPAIVLAALVAFFTIINPNFLSLANFARMSIAATPALLVALGVTFIIIMGSIDLSMEGIVSTTAVVFGWLFLALGGCLAEGWAWVALPAAILTGAVFGYVNGLVHVKLSIPSFMSSLAMGFVGTGIAVLMTSGERIRIEDDVFRALLLERFFGFPLMAYVGLAAVLLAWFIQRKTTLGRNFYAVGGGEHLAHASGLNVRRVRVLGFTLAGMFYAAAALLAVARLGIAEANTGSNYMFVSITSVVVGGTTLLGGSGGVWNTVAGVLIVNVISNGMVVAGLPRYLQDGVLGLLVIIAVVLSTDRKSISFVK